LWVLLGRESRRDSTAILEIGNAEFPLGGNGHPQQSYQSLVLEPFDQTRGSMTRKERAVFS
jgi:hypothetical protein